MCLCETETAVCSVSADTVVRIKGRIYFPLVAATRVETAINLRTGNLRSIQRARGADKPPAPINKLSPDSIVQRSRCFTGFAITNAEMLFYSFFKTLVAKKVTIELKNDLKINGVLHSVDQYLNIKLTQVDVINPGQHPHLSSVTSVFIRGSVVRYVHIDPSNVDVTLLQDATRREYREGRNPSS